MSDWANENENALRNPGEVLLNDFMRPLGLTAYRVAKELGVPPITISEIVRGLRSISPAMACRLGAYFEVEPLFWMRLQADREIAHAMSNGAHHGVTPCEELKGRSLQLREIGQSAMWTKSGQVEIKPNNGRPPADSGDVVGPGVNGARKKQPGASKNGRGNQPLPGANGRNLRQPSRDSKIVA